MNKYYLPCLCVENVLPFRYCECLRLSALYQRHKSIALFMHSKTCEHGFQGMSMSFEVRTLGKSKTERDQQS